MHTNWCLQQSYQWYKGYEIFYQLYLKPCVHNNCIFLSKVWKNLVTLLGILNFKCNTKKDFGPHCVTPVSCCSMSTSFVIMTKKLQEMVENEHIFQLVIIFMDHSTFSEVFATTYLLLPIPFLLLLLHNAAKLFLILLKFRNSGKATKFCKNIFQFLLLLKIT